MKEEKYPREKNIKTNRNRIFGREEESFQKSVMCISEGLNPPGKSITESSDHRGVQRNSKGGGEYWKK